MGVAWIARRFSLTLVFSYKSQLVSGCRSGRFVTRPNGDYKLSSAARNVRWAVVVIGYVLAAGLPGPAVVRLVPGFAGLSFLCWPNLAYHLTNLFVAWPTTDGRVDSATQDGSRSVITYTFELGQDIFGGTATLRDMIPYSEGEPVKVAYDPLNPDQSKVLSRNSVN